MYALKYYASPVGQLRLIADESYLIGVIWQQEQIHRLKNIHYCTVKQHHILDESIRQLDEYFNHQRQSFDLPTQAFGTDFQHNVWNALKSIPYGETRNYQDIAQIIGNPKAVRAVGLANGQNPLSIIVPCHRVIGKNGQLVGFGGGLSYKAYLLALEQNQAIL